MTISTIYPNTPPTPQFYQSANVNNLRNSLNSQWPLSGFDISSSKTNVTTPPLSLVVLCTSRSYPISVYIRSVFLLIDPSFLSQMVKLSPSLLKSDLLFILTSVITPFSSLTSLLLVFQWPIHSPDYLSLLPTQVLISVQEAQLVLNQATSSNHVIPESRFDVLPVNSFYPIWILTLMPL